MPTNRLAAFSDGVLAIAITLMVLNLTRPEHTTLGALWSETGPQLLTYLLTFVMVGIYWNNHHHLFQAAQRIDGIVLWMNLHLLFWLSLLPFTTDWMDRSSLAPIPVLVYGVNLLVTAIAYTLLPRSILRSEGNTSRLRRALGRDWKGKASIGLYAVGIVAIIALKSNAPRAAVTIALGCYVAVALLWFVPDRRIERSTAD